MKLILEKEYRDCTGNPWYRITLDDVYVEGSYDLEKIQATFEKIKADPTMLNKEKEVLRSEEISVNL